MEDAEGDAGVAWAVLPMGMKKGGAACAPELFVDMGEGAGPRDRPLLPLLLDWRSTADGPEGAEALEVVVITRSPGLWPVGLAWAPPRRAEWSGEVLEAEACAPAARKPKGCGLPTPAGPAATSTREAAADAAATVPTVAAIAAAFTTTGLAENGSCVVGDAGELAWSESIERADGGGFVLASATTASAISWVSVAPAETMFLDLRLFISSRRPANFE